MSGPLPVPYRIIPSGRVSAEVKALHRRAGVAGLGHQVISALEQINRVLSIYPQVGEPLRDLAQPGETIYVATFAPLYVEYIIDEPHRCVFIVVPFKVLPNSGFK